MQVIRQDTSNTYKVYKTRNKPSKRKINAILKNISILNKSIEEQKRMSYKQRLLHEGIFYKVSSIRDILTLEKRYNRLVLILSNLQTELDALFIRLKRAKRAYKIIDANNGVYIEYVYTRNGLMENVIQIRNNIEPGKILIVNTDIGDKYFTLTRKFKLLSCRYNKFLVMFRLALESLARKEFPFEDDMYKFPNPTYDSIIHVIINDRIYTLQADPTYSNSILSFNWSFRYVPRYVYMFNIDDGTYKALQPERGDDILWKKE